MVEKVTEQFASVFQNKRGGKQISYVHLQKFLDRKILLVCHRHIACWFLHINRLLTFKFNIFNPSHCAAINNYKQKQKLMDPSI